jgi:phosphatase and actin regulator 4
VYQSVTLWKHSWFFPEPKKDKTDQSNGSISPSSEPPVGPTLPSPGGGGAGDPSSAMAVGAGKLERPSSLGPGKLTRRLLCYHSEHCMSHSSPPRHNNLASGGGSGELSVPLLSLSGTALFAVSRSRFLQVIL